MLTYFRGDQLGSVRGVTDAVGASIGTCSCVAFGNTIVHTGTVSASQYAGGYRDAGAGFLGASHVGEGALSGFGGAAKTCGQACSVALGVGAVVADAYHDLRDKL